MDESAEPVVPRRVTAEHAGSGFSIQSFGDVGGRRERVAEGLVVAQRSLDVLVAKDRVQGHGQRGVSPAPDRAASRVAFEGVPAKFGVERVEVDGGRHGWLRAGAARER